MGLGSRLVGVSVPVRARDLVDLGQSGEAQAGAGPRTVGSQEVGRIENGIDDNHQCPRHNPGAGA